MDTVEVICPHCSKTMLVNPEHSNMQVTCPHCQQLVTLPDLSAAKPVLSAPSTPAYSASRPNRMPPVRRQRKKIQWGSIISKISVILILLIVGFCVLYKFWLGPEREKARKQNCIRQLELIGKALRMYVDVSHDLPNKPGQKGLDMLIKGGHMGKTVTSIKKADRERSFRCPSADEGHYYYYLGGNGYLNSYPDLKLWAEHRNLPIVICVGAHNKTVHVLTLGEICKDLTPEIKTFELSKENLSYLEAVKELGELLKCTDSPGWQTILKNADAYGRK